MTWLLVGVGYALVLITCLSLCCAAADADWIADRVLAGRDDFEMRVASSMEDDE